MPKPNTKLLIILAFLAIYVIWGSTYLFNKIAVTELPPLFISSIRFMMAGIIIFIISKFLKLSLRISIKQFLNCTIAGFLFLVYGNGVYVWALKYVDSGFAALIASTQPLFVLFLMRLIDGKTMHRKSLVGVFLGIVGMGLLVGQNQITAKGDSILGIFMMLTCVLSWSYGSVFVSKADLPENFLVSTGYQILISSILLVASSLIFKEQWVSPMKWSLNVKWSMVVLIVLGGVVTFTAFNYLLKNVSTEKVATSAYVNPVIALFLGWLVLDERLTFQSIIAASVLLTGVYFITSRKTITTKTKI